MQRRKYQNLLKVKSTDPKSIISEKKRDFTDRKQNPKKKAKY